MIHRIITLIRKEFMALLRDKRSRAILIMPPIIQLVIFAFAATLEVRNNSITIYNEDAGHLSMELISRLTHAGAFNELNYVSSGPGMAASIENQESLLALHVPEHFTRNILSNQPVIIQVIVDGRRSNSGQIAMGYINRIITDLAGEGNQRNPAQVGQSEIVVRHLFNPNLLYLWKNIPGLLMILTTLVTMIVTALSVAREKELGTFDQLLVSPYSPGEILMGKAIPAYIVALAESLVILGIGCLGYGVPFNGSLLLLYGALSVYLLSLIGIGLFISSLCQTQQQSILGVFSFIVPAVLLSGFASPIENMPGWLQVFDWINPLRHFFVISKGLFLKEMTMEMIWPFLWPLLVIGSFTLLSANWLFRHKLD